jgi:DNA-binding NarL/FixJ family response regulator
MDVMITIVVADDHPLVRQGLRAVFHATDDLHVVGEAADGKDAVRVCVERVPDVALMDLQMPEMSGLDATVELTRGAPATRVLVLTMFDDDETVFAAVRAGAVGYLLKGADGADIVAAVRAAAGGQAVFGAALAKRLQSWFARAGSNPEQAFPGLTEREREILDGVAAGLTNHEIGGALFLSPKTVANNVSAILDKLHFANRAEAIVRAREVGLGQSRKTSEL